MSDGVIRPNALGRNLDRNEIFPEASAAGGPAAQIQNVQASRVYVFGDSDLAEEELYNDQTPTFELRSRGGTRQETQEEESSSFCIEKGIAAGDTLQSISLKYGCPVAELKRVNNLIKDQDFYALVSIKVPVKRHGLLTELLAEDGIEGASASTRLSNGLHSEAVCNSDTDYEDVEGEDKHPLLVRTLSIRGALSTQGQEAQKFLRQMDKDIKDIISSTKNSKDSLQEVTQSLTCKRIQPFHRQSRCNSVTGAFSGADCGVRWWTVVAIMFTIGLVSPIVYLLYFQYIRPNT